MAPNSSRNSPVSLKQQDVHAAVLELVRRGWIPPRPPGVSKEDWLEALHDFFVNYMERAGGLGGVPGSAALDQAVPFVRTCVLFCYLSKLRSHGAFVRLVQRVKNTEYRSEVRQLDHDDRKRARALLEHVADLRPIYRETLQLYCSGLSCAEIAVELSINYDCARRRLKRGAEMAYARYLRAASQRSA